MHTSRNANRIVVERPTDTVIVEIMYDKNTNKYCFVNLTKSHVCECRFNTYEDALVDLENQKREGKVLEWWYFHLD